MPYRSKAQQRWMHANHPKIAAKWDKLTDFSSLPDKVDEDASLPPLPSTPKTPKPAKKTNIKNGQTPLKSEKGKKVLKELETLKPIIKKTEASTKIKKNAEPKVLPASKELPVVKKGTIPEAKKPNKSIKESLRDLVREALSETLKRKSA